MEDIIELVDIKFSYDPEAERNALDGVSFQIKKASGWRSSVTTVLVNQR